MYNGYINHSMCGMSMKHNSLPILAQTEFDFYRYVTFTITTDKQKQYRNSKLGNI